MTKILASLPMIMKLEEEEVFSFDTQLDELLPSLKNSNKDTVTVREVLSHVGRLKAWIPFYLFTLDSLTKKPSDELYATKKRKNFNLKVADNLYMKDDYVNTMYDSIYVAEQRNRKGYKYSDLPYYLFKKFIEKHYNSNLDKLTKTHFYNSQLF